MRMFFLAEVLQFPDLGQFQLIINQSDLLARSLTKKGKITGDITSSHEVRLHIRVNAIRKFWERIENSGYIVICIFRS